MSKSPTKSQALANVQAIIAGTQKHPPSGPILLGNVAYTSASLLQLFESLVTALLAETAANAAAKEARLSARGTSGSVGAVLKAYRTYLLTAYGSAAQTLADFGLTPKKAPKPLTVEAKSAKIAQDHATRAARGTVGPKERLKIKGTVAKPAEQAPAAPATTPAKPTA